MNIFLTILLVILAIIASLLLLALFLKKDHYGNREIIINAPRQEVYDFLKYPLNLLIPMAEKNFAKDMDGSLVTLKSLLEE